MSLKLINYDKLMANDPTWYHEIKNQLGQLVTFYEHPFLGDESSVLGTINNVAFDTGFFDTEDMYKDSDYLPVLCGGLVCCYFEL